MMVEDLDRVCGKKVSSSRSKISLTAWLFTFWFCLHSISVMYQTVHETERVAATKATLKEPSYAEAATQLDMDTNGIKGSPRISFSSFNEYVAKSEKLCWLVLFASIFTETAATAVSKYASDRSSATLLALACFMVILSQCGLTVSLAQIDVGVAYAMWAAVGTATVSFCAMFLFAEEFDLVKVGCLIMIIVGVTGLNLREEH